MDQKMLLQAINDLQPKKGHYRYYQGYERIGLKGMRPVEERYSLYRLARIIQKKSKVLDLGSNIGCMSLHVAERAGYVTGIESFGPFVEISSLIKEYLQVKNCQFFHMKLRAFQPIEKVDILLALAIHPPMELGFKVFADMIVSFLKQGGHLLIESRDFRRTDTSFSKCIKHLETLGLQTVWKDVCQCTDPNGIPNQKRKYHVMKLS